MVSHISSFAFLGIDVVDVDVQVQISSGMVTFTIVGLADKAVTESRERVRAAIGAIGLSLPPKRLVVNLAPADLQKEGSHFDLAIALGLLANMGVVPEDILDNYVVIGELSLDGSISAITGALPAAIGASARNKGIICPKENGGEAAWAGEKIDIIAADNLISLINHLKGTQLIARPKVNVIQQQPDYLNLADIKGQEVAKRALEIAAAGGHNMLMIGPPGAGKSMLASRLPGLMPELSAEEMLEVSMINSVTGNLVGGKLTQKRPFRDPHHNCSMPAMVGGGTKARPGEVTLAHCGVLFLDELPEFQRQVLDSLRQPIESRKITVSRVHSHVTYPANFQLVAAMNPCRCGYLGDALRACSRAPSCAVDYQAKLSGPLLDRIDIHVDVAPIIPGEALYKARKSEDSNVVAIRVKKARDIQLARYANNNIRLNSEADGELLEKVTNIDSECKKLMEQGMEKLKLSMRGYSRVLKVARTIADLENSEFVKRQHIAEALSYRQKSVR